jgi:hypothetical protein
MRMTATITAQFRLEMAQFHAALLFDNRRSNDAFGQIGPFIDTPRRASDRE